MALIISLNYYSLLLIYSTFDKLFASLLRAIKQSMN